MGSQVDGVEAVVLRTMRFGEADLIAHVHTLRGGRRGVIAKGARRPKSRLGARLEPFLAVRLQLHQGRGDLATVRGVEVLAAHERLRGSWRAQQTGATALDLVSKLSVEHEPNQAMHHLLRNFLDVLDAVAASDAPENDPAATEHRNAALLAAFELKLLHVSGMAPQLGACVRCGAEHALVGYAASDGGVVCRACRGVGDVGLAPEVHAAAVLLMRTPLVGVVRLDDDELPPHRVVRTVGSSVIAPTAEEHAGVRSRR